MSKVSWDTENARKYINRLLEIKVPVAISATEHEAVEWCLWQARVLEKVKEGLEKTRDDRSDNWAVLAWIHDLENPKPKGKWEKLREWADKRETIITHKATTSKDYDLLSEMDRLEREHPE